MRVWIPLLLLIVFIKGMKRKRSHFGGQNKTTMTAEEEEETESLADFSINIHQIILKYLVGSPSHWHYLATCSHIARSYDTTVFTHHITIYAHVGTRILSETELRAYITFYELLLTKPTSDHRVPPTPWLAWSYRNAPDLRAEYHPGMELLTFEQDRVYVSIPRFIVLTNEDNSTYRLEVVSSFLLVSVTKEIRRGWIDMIVVFHSPSTGIEFSLFFYNYTFHSIWLEQHYAAIRLVYTMYDQRMMVDSPLREFRTHTDKWFIARMVFKQASVAFSVPVTQNTKGQYQWRNKKIRRVNIKYEGSISSARVLINKKNVGEGKKKEYPSFEKTS